jgi:hypothetical protein
MLGVRREEVARGEPAQSEQETSRKEEAAANWAMSESVKKRF